MSLIRDGKYNCHDLVMRLFLITDSDSSTQKTYCKLPSQSVESEKEIIMSIRSLSTIPNMSHNLYMLCRPTTSTMSNIRLPPTSIST